MIKEQDDINKIHLYAKDLSEIKNEFLINKRQDVEIKYFNDPMFMKILLTTTQAEKEKS